MRIIVGLGNPGKQYEKQRHNIGFMALDHIFNYYDFAPWQSKYKALIASGEIDHHKILLIKPQNFMNNSGAPLAQLLQFYKLPISAVTVIYDDLELAFGKIKIKSSFGAAGHNGIRSINKLCGHHYQRIRLGIGRPAAQKDEQTPKIADFVLSNFTSKEQAIIDDLLYRLAQHFALYLNDQQADFIDKLL